MRFFDPGWRAKSDGSHVAARSIQEVVIPGRKGVEPIGDYGPDRKAEVGLALAVPALPALRGVEGSAVEGPVLGLRIVLRGPICGSRSGLRDAVCGPPDGFPGETSEENPSARTSTNARHNLSTFHF